MPQVTALKAQKNKKRVNVFIDGKFRFGIDLDNLVRFGIKENKDFSEEEISKIVFESEFQKTFERLLNFSTLRPRSHREVHDWMKRKKVPVELEEKLFQRLEKLELVNDYKFAKWWKEQRATYKKKGRLAITSELIQKGIDKKIIDQIFEEEPVNEKKQATEVLKKTAWKWQRYDENIARKKKSEFLYRRGFNWETIRSVLDVKDSE